MALLHSLEPMEDLQPAINASIYLLTSRLPSVSRFIVRRNISQVMVFILENSSNCVRRGFLTSLTLSPVSRQIYSELVSASPRCRCKATAFSNSQVRTRHHRYNLARNGFITQPTSPLSQISLHSFHSKCSPHGFLNNRISYFPVGTLSNLGGTPRCCSIRSTAATSLTRIKKNRPR
jgi:hypothetical protein